MTVAPALVSIVDDDASVRKGLARLVKAAGYEVETFASATEYLARPRPEDPCCLLLDVRMPGLSGLELLMVRAPEIARRLERAPWRTTISP